MTSQRFEFAFTQAYRLAAASFGVTAKSAFVEVDDAAELMTAKYGPWVLRSPLSNITGVKLTGPYRTITTIGPAHLSFADRGLTFASNPERGVCIRFAEPVRGIEPTGRIRHPGLTVTVDDCAGLAAALASAA